MPRQTAPRPTATPTASCPTGSVTSAPSTAHLARRVAASGVLVSALLAVAAAPAGAAPVKQPASDTVTSEFDGPSGLAIDGGHLWVTNQAGDSVVEIDPSTRHLLATVKATGDHFDQPAAIVAAGDDLLVANEGGAGSVTELSGSDGGLVRSISGTSYGFDHPVALATAGGVAWVLNAGAPSASPAVAGSVTAIDTATGALLAHFAGASLHFDDPAALAVDGSDLFVADKGNDSVTELDGSTGALVRVITAKAIQAPDGIAVTAGTAWVSDSTDSAVTAIDAATGKVDFTRTDSDGGFGFEDPSVAIVAHGNVFVATPYGTSPMVTKIAGSSGDADWYMCNTNGPYYFSDLSAFAVSGTDLWVASRSGANSPTPGAANGSLTEMSTRTGALIATVPAPA